MNKVYLIGNLTKDPENSETTNGTAYCRFTIAVNRPYTDENGDRQADFFNVIAWRGLAENCGRYLAKGRKVAIDGRLQNRSYEDKDGNRRTVTEIIAEEVEFLTPKVEETAPAPAHAPGKPAEQTQEQMILEGVNAKRKATLTPVNDDRLPF